MNRYLTELAKDYDPLGYKAEGSYMSEKYDGVRALWLPFTRGLLFSTIPWANRLRDDKEYVCSGLWTRRGKTIQAPASFLDALPHDTPLDGELYIARGKFQETLSVVRKHEPIESEWEAITYKVFNIPSYEMFFQTGQVREGGTAGEPAYEVYFLSKWADTFPGVRESRWWKPRRFTDNLIAFRKHNWELDSPVRIVEQTQLPAHREQAELLVQDTMLKYQAVGGEGVMLRRGHMLWEPIRHADLAKVKPLKDSEGEVIGYVLGKPGKYEGMIGSLRLRWKPETASEPLIFDLSGLTDRERVINNAGIWKQGDLDHGKYFDGFSLSSQFPIGSRITFLYNDLTKKGIPKFARYYRPAEVI